MFINSENQTGFMLAQFLGQGDWISTVIWFLLFILFIFFGPRLMVTQTIWKLERDVAELEFLANKSRKIVLNSITKKPKASLKESIRSFMEFFIVPPVDVDPYGVVKKLDHVIRNSNQRFNYFVNQVAPDFSLEKKNNLKFALIGAMMVHQIAKIVRHFLELIKKYKIFQLALLLQMQLPIIKTIAKSSVSATKAFIDGLPIGDSIGPLVAANLMKRPRILKEEEFAYDITKIKGRKVIVAKASGPGASLGYPGKFLQKLLKKQKITRIITIDAAGKLEGEETGSIAEGVGIAMGGPGVDRYEIEEIAVNRNIPLDAIAIKQSGEEEASVPMKKEILNSVPNVMETIKSAINRAKKNDKILIIGVGNSSGIGNDVKSAKEAEEKLKKFYKKVEKFKQKKKNPWYKF